MSARHVVAVFGLPEARWRRWWALGRWPPAPRSAARPRRGPGQDTRGAGWPEGPRRSRRAGGWTLMEHLIHEAYALIPRHGPLVLFPPRPFCPVAGAPIPTSAMVRAAGASSPPRHGPVGDGGTDPRGRADRRPIGFFAGRFGGEPLWARFRRNPKLAPTMDRAQAELKRRAVVAVLLSRSPLSALGPWITPGPAGATAVDWRRFSAGVLWAMRSGSGSIWWAGMSLRADQGDGHTMTSAEALALLTVAARSWAARSGCWRRGLRGLRCASRAPHPAHAEVPAPSPDGRLWLRHVAASRSGDAEDAGRAVAPPWTNPASPG